MAFGCCEALGQEAISEPKTSAPRIGQVTETLTLSKTGGGSEKVLVELDDWRFDPGNTEMSMPSGGATIIAVSNGSVSVTMEGTDEDFRHRRLLERSIRIEADGYGQPTGAGRDLAHDHGGAGPRPLILDVCSSRRIVPGEGRLDGLDWPAALRSHTPLARRRE